MTNNLTEKILKSIKNLETWFDNNGWYGYDPYDIFDIDLIRNIVFSDNFFLKVLPSRILNKSIEFFPLISRKILKVKKEINFKGLGLLSNAYINLYNINANEYYRKNAEKILDYLINEKSKLYPGYSWGYPFDWQSRILIPKYTPSSVVSSAVGNSFWEAFISFKDEKYLEVCVGICDFFIKSLNIYRKNNRSICFSYTPIDDFQVHNANLFVAEFLTRIGKEINNDEYIEKGVNAGNFALEEQLNDGSLNYFSDAQNSDEPNKNDHYHVGFEIRSLYGIWKNTGIDNFLKSAEKYYKYYKNNFLIHKGNILIPKMYPSKPFPLDIHACAESIILNIKLCDTFPEAKGIADKFIDWIIHNMQQKNGSFIYTYDIYFGIPYKTKIPYHRWGQCWMFYALSLFLSNSKK